MVLTMSGDKTICKHCQQLFYKKNLCVCRWLNNKRRPEKRIKIPQSTKCIWTDSFRFDANAAWNCILENCQFYRRKIWECCSQCKLRVKRHIRILFFCSQLLHIQLFSLFFLFILKTWRNKEKTRRISAVKTFLVVKSNTKSRCDYWPSQFT